MRTLHVRRLATTAQDRLRPLLALSVWYVVIGTLLRIVLWTVFGRAQQVGDSSLAWILGAGVVVDIVQSLYLLAPLALFLWLVPDRRLQSRLGRALLFTGAFAWMFALGFVSITEYFFFEEFD